MPAGQFCNTCEFWESPFSDRYGERFGLCTCPTTQTSILKDKDENSYDAEDSPLWTQEYFGCVNHEVNMSRTEIDPPTMFVGPAPDDDDE